VFTIAQARLGPVINSVKRRWDKLDGSEEVPRGLLVASGDRTKLLDPGEKALDQMARRIKLSIIVAR
jgi:hypothetical protein